MMIVTPLVGKYTHMLDDAMIGYHVSDDCVDSVA